MDVFDPVLPHPALAAAPVSVRVREGVKHRLVGGAKEQLLREPKALGAIEDRLVAAERGDAALDSCHSSNTGGAAHGLAVAVVHRLLLVVRPLPLLRLVLPGGALPAALLPHVAGLCPP